MGSVHGLLMSVKCGKPAKMLISSSSIRWCGQKWVILSKNLSTQLNTTQHRFQPFLTKKSEKSNRQNFLSSWWSAQTPSKPPSAHTPDQAQHTKPCLGTFGRLGTKKTGVLCIDRKKNRRWRSQLGGGYPGTTFGAASGKSAHSEFNNQ